MGQKGSEAAGSTAPPLDVGRTLGGWSGRELQALFWGRGLLLLSVLTGYKKIWHAVPERRRGEEQHLCLCAPPSLQVEQDAFLSAL